MEKVYQLLSEFREPLFKRIIKSLNISDGSKGLDAGCGIGYFTNLLHIISGKKNEIIGLDYSPDFIIYANKHYAGKHINFLQGDINKLEFNDNCFDWIWSADTVWPGPAEKGCPAKEPFQILKNFQRILKPGGKVYLLYWTSQKFLPGYPGFEARLNTTSSAIAPFVENMNPQLHVMNTSQWLRNTGFTNISTSTFVHHISSPLSTNEKDALFFLYDMLWSSALKELNMDDQTLYKKLLEKESNQNILTSENYEAFYTYTLFSGTKN